MPLLFLAGTAEALILSTWDGPTTPSSVNTTAPAIDPGWANSGDVGSGVYLGNQWALTAEHVPADQIVLPSGTYAAIPGSEIVLTNPTFFDANGNGVANGFGVNSETLTANSDLKLFRIDTHPVTGMTPEQMDASVRSITLAPETPEVGTDLIAVSAGTRRVVNPNNPNGRWRFDSSFNLTSDLNSPHEGFLTSNSNQPATVREKAWGTNQIAAAGGAPGVVDDGLNAIARASGINDTVGVLTRFDRGVDNNGNPLPDGGLPDEFQAAAGDSGGPVYAKYNFTSGEYVEPGEAGEWVLTGVFHNVIAVSGQPSAGVPIYGQHTALSDLSLPHYADQIAAARASELYSIDGDLDLDGAVTGEIINGVPTGDLSVLVNGWDYRQSEGDIISWKQGDLTQDGVVDIADFVRLRSALGGSISYVEFGALVGISVPEPAGLLLAAAAALLVPRRRR